MDENVHLNQGVLVKYIEKSQNKQNDGQDSNAFDDLTSPTLNMKNQHQGSSPKLTSNTTRPLTVIMYEYIKNLEKIICDLENELDENDEEIIEVRTQLTKEKIDKDTTVRKNEELQIHNTEITKKQEELQTEVNSQADIIKSLTEEQVRTRMERETVSKQIEQDTTDDSAMAEKSLTPRDTSISIESLMESIRRIDERCNAIDLNVKKMSSNRVNQSSVPETIAPQEEGERFPYKEVTMKHVSNSSIDYTASMCQSNYHPSEENIDLNVMIFGMHEKADDEKDVMTLLKGIDADVTPRRILRLRTSTIDQNKPRPIKVTMMSKNDKERIMRNLYKLQYLHTYGRISVKDDYTYEERILIRDKVREAQKKNEEDNTTGWKVRGSPRTKLRIVNIAIPFGHENK